MTDLESPPATLLLGEEPPPRAKPRLRKLRLLGLLIPLALLALVSTVFGMMMAVASDLPGLENEKRFQGEGAKNSVLYDAQNQPLGLLTSNEHRIYVRYGQIAPVMRAAIISVEDQRFFTNSGVDLRGIARAFTQDLLSRGAVQGGSTITQQFVKQALQAQGKRTVFEKLREAALAYHLTRKWSKQKILTEYLNSIYFGNGAYGIEAAAQTYFGDDVNHQGCGSTAHPCAKELQPQEAALLAGIVQNPSGYDPAIHPLAALRRRNAVLAKMRQQGYLSYLTPSQYAATLQEALPGRDLIHPPAVDSKAPYFTTWVRQQLVDRYGAQRTFEGGLNVRTTLDLAYQQAAQRAVDNWLGNNPAGPTAALVAIDNKTGEVRAMVSGSKDYVDRPFNLATQGQRQPGSAFKPFILARALEDGISPSSVWTSAKKTFCVVKTKKGCKEAFPVENDEGAYVGQRTLANALTFSDNTVFSEVGIKIGTRRVATLARRMGIRTSVSHNFAMTLGGLKEGVTPLDMAHAYETFAMHGKRVSGTLGAPGHGPVGIKFVKDANGHRFRNRVKSDRILPSGIADEATQIMTTVLTQGTAKRASIGGFAAGKTGTTSNYGDAWFVGFTDHLTVAVWVGYPDKLVSMKTDFNGAPVEGGTFPALIWHDFQEAARAIYDERDLKRREASGEQDATTTDESAGGTTVESTTSTGPAKSSSTGATSHAATPATKQTPKAAPVTPAQEPPAATTPTPGAESSTPGTTGDGGDTAGAGGAPATP